MAVERDTLTRARTVMARCDLLAHISEEEHRLTRRYGTPALRAAQDTVAGWMEATGMTVRRDAIGNLIGRYEGRKAGRREGEIAEGTGPPPRLPVSAPLLIGGHLDTVRDAGRYDGMLGVLVGIACVESLLASADELPCPIEVIAFADEEGLRFHTAYLGSWAFCGTLDPALLTRTDVDGVSLAEAIRAFGGDPDTVVQSSTLVSYRGFIEVHIEQGPVLDAAGMPVGVVTAIAGQTRAVVTFTGSAGHAGTVPMDHRRDALSAAAAFVLAVESTGQASASLVATVGQFTVEPGASNVIPGQVRLTIDVRHAGDAIRLTAVDAILEHAATIGRSRGIEVAISGRTDVAAITSDTALTDTLSRAIAGSGYPVRRLVSGAGHDAVALSPRMPVTMLFVRCAGGISHNPAESVTVDDVAVAIEVMDQALLDWSQS